MKTRQVVFIVQAVAGFRLAGRREQPDLIVDDLVIVDPKVVTTFNESHVAQMTGYLAMSGLKLALLINFKSAKLEWKRVVRSGDMN